MRCMDLDLAKKPAARDFHRKTFRLVQGWCIAAGSRAGSSARSR